MSDKYITSGTAITATADAIREKLGISDQIEWREDYGFAKDVGAIEVGSGGSGSGSGGGGSSGGTYIDFTATLLSVQQRGDIEGKAVSFSNIPFEAKFDSIVSEVE